MPDLNSISQDKINRLAELCGISESYQDWAGNTVQIPKTYKIPMLEAMGIDVQDEQHIEATIEKREKNQWSSLLPPVCVVHKGDGFSVPMYIPANRQDNTFKGRIELESGKRESIEVKAHKLEELDRKTLKKKDRVKLKLLLPEDLPLGYHRLYLKNRNLEAHCLLVVSPETCYEPESLSQGQKIWGSSLQLYTVRSNDNWGMGDFSDLKKLITQLAEQGAGIVGLNPIHSLYPANPEHCSPYSPSSRNFINPLYIDVMAVEDFNNCEKAQQLFDSQSFQQRLNEARSAEYVDYALVASLKYEMLEHLFAHFNEHHRKAKTFQGKAFDQFRKHRGNGLERHAIYEALFEHFKARDINSWGWPCWPEEYQDPESKEVKAFARNYKDRVLYFSWLQWLAERQLEQAQQASEEAGMAVGIYRDLAVGVDRGGSDVWSGREFYCLDASVGAPPDGVAPQGQNWGLPPFNPVALQSHRYLPFIEMVRANMNHCGALRIDHVMGLLRLWWCPTGKTADYGIYVNYPLDDLLGIIKLESHRHQCLIFGEDLGTVPEQIEAKLPPALCYSNEVVLFSCDGDRFIAPTGYKSRALTCISNHDIPTLKAWWNCNDLDLRQELGIYDAERTQAEKVARHREKVALLKTLAETGELPWGVNPDDISTMGFSQELMEKIHYYLAKTASRIVVIQLEDVLKLDTPVNVPGTSTEYPNWRRRLTKDFSELLSDQGNREFLKNISLTRQA